MFLSRFVPVKTAFAFHTQFKMFMSERSSFGIESAQKSNV